MLTYSSENARRAACGKRIGHPLLPRLDVEHDPDASRPLSAGFLALRRQNCRAPGRAEGPALIIVEKLPREDHDVAAS